MFKNVFEDVIKEGGKSSRVLESNTSETKSLKLMVNDLAIFKGEDDVKLSLQNLITLGYQLDFNTENLISQNKDRLKTNIRGDRAVNVGNIKVESLDKKQNLSHLIENNHFVRSPPDQGDQGGLGSPLPEVRASSALSKGDISKKVIIEENEDVERSVSFS